MAQLFSKPEHVSHVTLIRTNIQTMVALLRDEWVMTFGGILSRYTSICSRSVISRTQNPLLNRPGSSRRSWVCMRIEAISRSSICRELIWDGTATLLNECPNEVKPILGRYIITGVKGYRMKMQLPTGR